MHHSTFSPDREFLVTDEDTLKKLYGTPSEASLAKETDYMHPHYRRFIEVSPFFVLATSGPHGLDASPRGDKPGFVTVENEKTLLIPDRRGNNRMDSLRNIIHNPSVALFFLVPGIGESLRVNGRAQITVDPAWRSRFEMENKLPATVLIVHVEKVFFQCARAIQRSGLWDPSLHITRDQLPSTGTILEDLSAQRITASEYDRDLYVRQKNTLY
ncbi:MAG TPA: pyridoxamine 5'-phosphate oxidase family protein [bacterium]|nr:pyridoxamine 5'-phosphate oxidase family protein [bacterium]HMY34541.1 pyridoxamine 5'-phosphate oxidase family protein [bacterium]HMZ03330.1 pyridoxamine 5'-phosphate oxidase family protein [bacterium]HNB10345.1 pyridoxamine 5'-phosphate oxidase family protein [bacterium]HNB55789.1 pyridoxamine 5'-phosphate oxidase family protein [bacterium]